MLTQSHRHLLTVFGASVCLLVTLVMPLAAQAALSRSCEVRERLTGIAESYRPVAQVCKAGRTMLHAIRSFDSPSGEEALLTVNPDTFETRLIYARCLECSALTSETQTPYIDTVREATSAAYPMENDGFRHALNSIDAPVLTVDLCPSTKPFERRLFEGLLSSRLARPIPVAIAVTGGWMRHFPDDLNYLLGLVHSGDLAITWINHSNTHPYSRQRAIEDNFLLSAGVDFTSEVLGLELKELARGITPSVYFRFPGLVSDRRLMLALRYFGLIPVGSDAWLAKGQVPEDGSLILVHGNGNETEGVDRFLNRYLRGLDDLDSLSEAFNSNAEITGN